MIKVGITGTIASGKTTATILLRRDGYMVFDCDQYAHLAYRKDSLTYEAVVNTFGQSILDAAGEIDKEKLAKIIFDDDKKRKQLNTIVHPFVKEGLMHYFKTHMQDDICFAEIPLLFEAHWENIVDRTLLITCPKEVAIDRLINERFMTAEEAEKRYNSQIDPSIQMERADDVIINDGSIHELKAKLDQYILNVREGRWN